MRIAPYLALATVLSVVSSPDSHAQESPWTDDYVWINQPATSSWYAVTHTKLYWPDAQALARSLSSAANLATIESAAEEQFLVTHPEIGAAGGLNNSLWIGLNDVQVERQPEWASGQPVTYYNPDGQHNGDGQDYVALESVNGWWSWYSLTQDGGRPGLIEIGIDPTLDSDGGGTPDFYEDNNLDGVIDSWETDPADPHDDARCLYVSNLAPGERAYFRAVNFAPHSYVIPLVSLAGPGPSDIGYGITASLSPPIYELGAVPLDGNGRAHWSPPTAVPSTLTHGQLLWIQGIELSFSSTGLLLELTNSITIPVGAN